MNIEQSLNVSLRNKELFNVFSGKNQGQKGKIRMGIMKGKFKQRQFFYYFFFFFFLFFIKYMK